MVLHSNELFVKGNVIYVTCHGKQDEWTVRRTVVRFLEEAEKIKAKQLSVQCVVDLSDDVGYDIGARNAATEAIKKDAVPTAIIGISKNTALQTVFNFMTRLAGQGSKYKLFSTLEEGEKWLKSL